MWGVRGVERGVLGQHLMLHWEVQKVWQVWSLRRRAEWPSRRLMAQQHAFLGPERLRCACVCLVTCGFCACSYFLRSFKAALPVLIGPPPTLIFPNPSPQALAENKVYTDNRDHLIQTFEQTVKMMQQGVEQWVWICDFHGFGLSDALNIRIARVRARGGALKGGGFERGCCGCCRA